MYTLNTRKLSYHSNSNTHIYTYRTAYITRHFAIIELYHNQCVKCINHDQLLLSSKTMDLYESLIVLKMPSSPMLQKSSILQVGTSKPQAC